MNRAHQALVEKLQALPPQRLAEIEDFVDFITIREHHSRLTQTASKMAEPIFGQVWENDDDDAYNLLGNKQICSRYPLLSLS